MSSYSFDDLPVNVRDDLSKLASITKFDPSQLPSVISDRVDQIEKLSEKKKEAEEKALMAQEAADEARKIKTKRWLSGNKDAIEHLQNAVSMSADAIESLVDAQGLAFESIEKLAEVENFLLGVGVLNSALNRMVIRELELRLKNASKERLSELAKQEIENVLRQLHAQEDAAKRIECHADALHNHDSEINDLKIGIASLRDNTNKEILKSKEAAIKAASDNIEKVEHEILSQTDRLIIETKNAAIKEASESLGQTRKEIEDLMMSMISEAKNYANKTVDTSVESARKEIEEQTEKMISEANQFTEELGSKRLQSEVKALKSRISLSYVVGGLGLCFSIAVIILSFLGVI